jgi:hypothetical protein
VPERSTAWPNLFIVGVAHAGTTSLWRNLGSHPEIWMSPVKEPNFFSGVRWPLNEEVHDEASYLRLFEPGASSRLRGEASCSYLWSTGVPARIRAVSPEARILISLRDPVERAHSSYWYSVRIGAESRSFPETIGAELAGGPQSLIGASYARNVERYLDLFPRAVHVLFFEELIADPERETRKVFDFLGVDARPGQDLAAGAHNAHALPRNRLAALLYGRPRVRAGARVLAPRRLRPSVEKLLMRRGPRDPIDSETDEELTEFFSPDVSRLEELLGRQTPWPRFREARSATP